MEFPVPYRLAGGIGLALLLSACAAVQPSPPPTATPAPTSTPTPEPGPSYQQIADTWADTDTLARAHLNEQELTCQACHPDAAPDQPVERPSGDVCLTCHGPTLEDLMERTNDDQEYPHRADHVNEISCTFCHAGHDPDPIDACTVCH
jgi:hypothetical protein